MNKLIKLLNLDANATEDDIVAVVSALQQKIAVSKAKKKEADEFDAAVARRMRPGLSREQAEGAERRQREFDARKKAAAKAPDTTSKAARV